MIVVCGEALIDLVPAAGQPIPRPGGSAANVAVALGRLGTDVAFLGRLSTDHYGRLLREHLGTSHVDLSPVVPVAEPTTVATVRLGVDGNAGYTFAIEGSADGTWRPADLPATLPPGAALHVSGSFALAVPGLAETVEALLHREHGQRVISFDPNPRPALAADPPAVRARLERWAGLADIVKVSAEDLAWAVPGESTVDVARRWQETGSALVVVTRGSDGVYARGPAGEASLVAHSATLVDSVGAGDAFMAGLLAALDRTGDLTRERLARLRTVDLVAGLRYAQRVAAFTCGRPGADPPWRHEL